MGETLAEAVVREVREETGLEVMCDGLVGWVERIGDDYHFVIFDFAVTVLDRHSPRPGDDAADAAWVTLAEVGDYALVDGLAEFLHDHGVVKMIAG
jgi:8-oxo-dGTP diphosphatase